MKPFVFGAIALLLIGCGDGSSVTGSGGGVVDGSDRVVSLTLNIGEHRDIELPAQPDTLYSVSSRALAGTGYEGSLSCTPTLSVAQIGTAENSVAYGIVDVAPSSRPVLRLIGVYSEETEEEVICIEAKDAQGTINRLRVDVTVLGPDGSDVIGGTPIDPTDPGDGGDGDGDGGDPGGPPEPPTDPGDPGEKPTYDPQACVTTSFYYVDDDYNDVEGKFGPDTAAYLRSTMPGSTVDSAIRLYYPAYTKPATIIYTDMGRYKFKTKENVMIEFDLQLGQHLFGQEKKYFYAKSNGYCMRGKIPSSVMTPPDKILEWVTNIP